MLRLICLWMLVIELFGCNSSALKKLNEADESQSSLQQQISEKEVGPTPVSERAFIKTEQNHIKKRRGGFGPRPKRPEVIPKDWPMTFEQFEFLMSGHLESMGRRSVDPDALNRAGFKNQKDLVAFAWEMLERDLSPFKRDQAFAPGHIHQVLYMIIGLHGDMKDAERLFHRLKNLKQKPSGIEPADEHVANKMLAQSMGLFLMRDHFMPQEDRALMEEIEDYLLDCTRYGTPSCWPREGLKSGDDEMRRYALMALAISCGEKGQARIQEYAEMPGDFSHIIADVNFKLRDQVLSHGEEILQMLSPVLPREK